MARWKCKFYELVLSLATFLIFFAYYLFESEDRSEKLLGSIFVW